MPLFFESIESLIILAASLTCNKGLYCAPPNTVSFFSRIALAVKTFTTRSFLSLRINLQHQTKFQV